MSSGPFGSLGKDWGKIVDHGILIIFFAGFGFCALLGLLGWGIYEAAVWIHNHVRII